MTTQEEKKLRVLCEKLVRNDPSVKSVDLSCFSYGEFDWQRTSQLAAALEQSTHVGEIKLCLAKIRITPDGYTPLVHYLGTSTSLRKVCIAAYRYGETPEQDFGTTSVLEAVSHNKSVVSLCLEDGVFRRPETLEDILATTKTLTEFVFKIEWRPDNSDRAEVCVASSPPRLLTKQIFTDRQVGTGTRTSCSRGPVRDAVSSEPTKARPLLRCDRIIIGGAKVLLDWE